MKELLVMALALMSFSAVAKPAFYVPSDAPPIQANAAAIRIAHGLAATIKGKAASIAATGSMLPTLNAEDIIVYREISFQDIKEGDILVFEASMDGGTHMSIFAHRVIQVISESATTGSVRTVDANHHWVRTPGVRVLVSQELVTKGDNNPEPDSFRVKSDKIRGLIVYAINGQTGETRSMRN